MILGMSLATFTFVHTLISLIGIATGLVVVFGMLASRRLAGWTGLFLLSTVLTSVTGFMFHSARIGAPHVVGVISLIVLAFTLIAIYMKNLKRSWRSVYAIGAVVSLYLNAFVGIVQGFQKIPAVHAFAPKGNEPPFLVVQGLLLVLFVWLAVKARKSFHPDPGGPGLRIKV